MAKGKSSSHSKTPRPGKSNNVTNTAVAKPSTVTPTATIRHRPSVVSA
jgi:hypothetical protein